MLMPASEEFVALCRSQVAILTESLGAALSVVYLTEEMTEAIDAKLIPIVAHPEAAMNWDPQQVLALLARGKADNAARLLYPEGGVPALPGSADAAPAAALDMGRLPQEIVLPLIHEDMVMGLLVTARADRSWSKQESAEIEQVAQTLTLACVLDQRAQWSDQDLRQQRLLQAQQHDVFDDLLHQFRNPLTALRTFGKLLLRRMLPEDANHEVASGIVRESDRLQELLKQFDAAIDLGEADWLPTSSAAAVDWEARLESAPLSTETAAKPVPLLPSANYITGAELRLEPHTVAEVLQPLLVAAEAIAQERQLTLEVHIPADLPPVQIDLKALREVLNNLLDNALKYTPANGQVVIRAGLRRSGEAMQGVAIVDTGVGIPVQDRSHLFERHYRGVQAQTDIPGSGLGLAIARDLVQQMQGTIEVFSPASLSGLVQQQDSAQPGTALIVWLPEALFSS